MAHDISTLPVAVRKRMTSERLDSWKEIAAYLKREVRTVRRWETYEGLPVHRHLHKVRGSVYAFRPELDAWWTKRRAQGRSAAIILAVMPFENLGPTARQEHLTDALTSEVITQLARLGTAKLQVVARASTMRFQR